jgi:D-alanyl-D-alanine carboxypeptidase
MRTPPVRRARALLALVTCASAILAAHPAAAQETAGERLAQALDSIAAGAVAGGEVIGVTVAVLRAGEPVHVRGYGTAHLESLAAATESTVYHIGSITKPVTAAAVLHLAERGRLDLDDDVTRHVPELDSPGAPITIRQLLGHTSGLAGPGQVAGKFLERRHLEFSRADLVELLRGEPRVSTPGERFAYNNLGYLLLGIVVERVSGRTYEDYLRDEVLAPAGARSVALCDARRVIPHRAAGYELRDGTAFNHEPVNASLVFAAGGLCGNAADVAVWLRALAGGVVVAPEAFRRMTTRGVLADGSAHAYGYGLFVDSLAGHPRIHHGGDVNGYSGHAAHYPGEDVTVVVLTNTRGTAARRIEQRIARRLLGIADG